MVQQHLLELRCVLEGDGAEGNEGLVYLLAPMGKTAQIGAEKGKAPKSGIGLFKSTIPLFGASYRYVYMVDGTAVSALQVMVPKQGTPRIANVYTAGSYRRQGYAAQLLRRAEKDLGIIAHSDDLSPAGTAWKSHVARSK